MERFRITLRELRKEHGMSQTDLAEKLGCAASTICMYEQGRREPSLDIIRTIAGIFGVPVEYLVAEPARDGEDELWDLREQLRRRPEMRMLFSATRRASRDDVLKAVKIIEALRGDSDA